MIIKKMKRLLFVFSCVLMLASCGNPGSQGELVGVRKSNATFSQPDPYGMVFIPMGSFTMGVGGEENEKVLEMDGGDGYTAM